jgi:hypothetical protein
MILRVLAMLLCASVAWAGSDIRFVDGVGTVKLPIYADGQHGTGLVPGLVLGTTVQVLVQCGTGPTVILASTDPFVDNGGGVYTITTTAGDAIVASPEAICKWSAVGIGAMGGRLDQSTYLTKATESTMSGVIVGSYIDGQAPVGTTDNPTLDAGEIGTDAKQQAGFCCTITASGAGNSTTVIESADLTATVNKAYIGMRGLCVGATNTDNRVIPFKIIAFDPATDRVSINMALAAALTVGDTCNLYDDTLR